MIASHDSFTYLPPRFAVMRLFSPWWRTQVKDIEAQRESGVGMLDIRVRQTGKGWQLCHGLVDLKLTFGSLAEIVEAFPGFDLRIILERGDTVRFCSECAGIAANPRVTFLCIKSGWHVLKDTTIHGKDYTYLPWLSNLGFWDNIKRFKFSTIKRWAREHNPVVTREMIESRNTHFMDYV